jgi:hypothetical protein
MIKMGKVSELVPSEVVEKAVAFFGPSGAGMKVMNQDDCCARFEGSGGYVYITAADIEGKEGSDVTVEGREWENPIKQFIGQI